MVLLPNSLSATAHLTFQYSASVQRSPIQLQLHLKISHYPKHLTMSTNVLAARDINTSAPHATKPDSKPLMANDQDTKSMEYHRQILQSKLAEDGLVHVVFLCRSLSFWIFLMPPHAYSSEMEDCANT